MHNQEDLHRPYLRRYLQAAIEQVADTRRSRA
jgi:hypothetical protein